MTLKITVGHQGLLHDDGKGGPENIDLGPDYVRRFLEICPWRLVITPAPAPFKGKETHLEVMYESEWWELARTDLMDDVCTTFSLPAPWMHDPDPLAWLRKLKFYGARLKQRDHYRTFALIDQYSDG